MLVQVQMQQTSAFMKCTYVSMNMGMYIGVFC